jgi:hypothetical protein
MQRGYSDGHGIPGSRIFIVNAPFIFPLFWQLVRPWLRAHLQVCSVAYCIHTILTHLQELVVVTAEGDYTALHERVHDPAQLPVPLGGALPVLALEDQEYATLLG